MTTPTGADDLFGPGWGTAPQPQGVLPTSSDNGGAADPFGSGFGARPAATFAVVHPPLIWLYSAVAVGLIALLLVVVLWGVVPVAIVGWLLGGAVTIALTSVFQTIDTARRTQLGYSSGRTPVATVLYIAALALGLTAVVISAVTLALWAGRGF